MAETIKVEVPATIKFVRSPKKRRALGTGSSGLKKGNVPNRMKYINGGDINDK